MPYVSPSQLNSILFESKADDKWDAFLERQEQAVRDEMHAMAGLDKERSIWEQLLQAVKDFVDSWGGRLSEEQLNEGSIKDALLGIAVAGLKVPEGLLKIFDVGVNMVTAIPAFIAGKGDDGIRAFLTATVGAGMASQALDVFQVPDTPVTMAVKIIWGLAFVIGAIRGVLGMKMDTASFIRNMRRSMNKMRDEPADIEVTRN